MAYTPTNWINDQPPPLSAANLNKLTDELRAQCVHPDLPGADITHVLPTWVNGGPPALTDSGPLSEMERVAGVAASRLGLVYTPTVWQQDWTPARNAVNFNHLEQQARANRAALDALAVPPSPPPGTLIWSGDFNTGNESQFDFIHRWTASEFLVTTSDNTLGTTVTPREGSHMARIQCIQGHPANWDAGLCASLFQQSSLAQKVGFNKQYVDSYMGGSCWVPANHDWVDPSMHSIIGEWHGAGGGTSTMSQAPFHFGILNSTGSYTEGASKAGWWFCDLFRAASGYSPVFQHGIVAFSPATANRWIDWVLRVKWSQGSDGVYQFWFDGNLVYTYNGPTAPVNGELLKPQHGLYKKNTLPNATIYIDAARIGTTYEIVNPAAYA